MKITLITVGKLKEAYFREAVAEYAKRLQRFGDLTLIEVPDEKTPDKASAAEEAAILDKEGARILSKIPAGAYVVTLEIEGESLSSPALAHKLQELSLRGQSHLCFIIGGSLGLCPRVKSLSHLALSFSRMTFPHQLMRVILLEQLYRACKINAGEPYHK